MDPSLKSFAKSCVIEGDGSLNQIVNGSSYAVAPKSIVPRLISEVHQDLLTHPNSKKVCEMIKKSWRWPKMHIHIDDIVRSCHKCQLFKDPKIPKQPISMIDREGIPFSKISADLSGPYVKSSKGNTQVFVVLCMITKYVLLFALKKAPSQVLAIGVSKCLLNME